jgi:hypothetical protein
MLRGTVGSWDDSRRFQGVRNEKNERSAKFYLYRFRCNLRLAWKNVAQQWIKGYGGNAAQARGKTRKQNGRKTEEKPTTEIDRQLPGA